MPEKTVSEGNTVRLFDGTPGTLYYLDSSGSIRLAQTREFARLARPVRAGLDIEVTVRSSGAVYAHAEENATITYERQGLSWQPRTSRGVEEVNADITDTIPGGTSTSSITRADGGEVWEVVALEINAPDVPTAGNFHNISIESETEAVEYGFARAEDGDIRYRSAAWEVGGPSVTTRGGGNIAEKIIDDTNGIEVVYESEDDDQTNDIKIRWTFRAIRT